MIIKINVIIKSTLLVAIEKKETLGKSKEKNVIILFSLDKEFSNLHKGNNVQISLAKMTGPCFKRSSKANFLNAKWLMG